MDLNCQLKKNLSQLKIPFRKLNWRDNTTDLGKKSGYVEYIGDIYQSGKHRNPFITYYISNNYGGKLNLKVQATQDGSHVGFFDSIDEAQDMCQKHFEETIIKTFFEL